MENNAETLKRSIKSLSFTESCRSVRGSKRNLPTRLGVLLLKCLTLGMYFVKQYRQKRDFPLQEK